MLYAISIFISALFGLIESKAGIPTVIVALFFFVTFFGLRVGFLFITIS